MNFSSSVPNFPLPAAYSSCDGRAHTHFYAYTAMSTDSWDLIGIVVLKSSALQHFSWASFNPVTHTRGILNIMSLSLQLAKDFFLISLLHYFNLITKLTEKKKCSEGNYIFPAFLSAHLIIKDTAAVPPWVREGWSHDGVMYYRDVQENPMLDPNAQVNMLPVGCNAVNPNGNIQNIGLKLSIGFLLSGCHFSLLYIWNS